VTADDHSMSSEGVLRRLVAEIAADRYLAKIGSPLVNNTAYLAAVAYLELKDLLATERDGSPRG
jgi:hypothetical protein